jgi:large subunit ribosomal protein L18
MATGADYVVPFRRKRDGKTNYKKRLDLLKSGVTRLVVRPSNKHIVVQLVDYKKDGDVIVSAAHSRELKTFGWDYATSNVPAAYLTGLLCGFRGQKRGVKRVVLDLGLIPSVRGSRSYSALKGAMDSGLNIPAGENVFPDEKRISGWHMADKGKGDITENFETSKKKIMQNSKKGK